MSGRAEIKRTLNVLSSSSPEEFAGDFQPILLPFFRASKDSTLWGVGSWPFKGRVERASAKGSWEL